MSPLAVRFASDAALLMGGRLEHVSASASLAHEGFYAPARFALASSDDCTFRYQMKYMKYTGAFNTGSYACHLCMQCSGENEVCGRTSYEGDGDPNDQPFCATMQEQVSPP